THHAFSAREIRAVLAETARVTEAEHPGVQLEFTTNKGELVSYEAISPWQNNAAGVNYHPFYGFGAGDEDDAMNRPRRTN
ncbi:peptidase S8, partial [Vibrio parahaemolyticus]|nr:peptidase S8 [Vibrio parahaemolyticus]